MLPFYRFTIVAALLGSLVLTPAHAAELGDPVIRTHMGQPLIADVELNTLNDPASTVTVRMAHADVYKGANVSMNPVVGSINMSVMKRDGRQYLHITSTRVVSTENVHLFLELTDGGKRTVRAVTLWLTPDPSPPPPPPPMPLPPATPVIATPAPAPVAVARSVSASARPVRMLTLPMAPVTAATCPQAQFTSDQIKACEVMDEKNAALSAQIVDLEAKVKLLQLAIEGKALAPVAASAPAVPPLPRKKQSEEGGFPWLLASGIVVLLSAIGAGVWYFLRRRKGAVAAADSAVSAAEPWHQRLRARFTRSPKPAAAEAPPAS